MALQQNQAEILFLINSIQGDLDRLRTLVQGHPHPVTILGPPRLTRPPHAPPAEVELGPLRGRRVVEPGRATAKREEGSEMMATLYDSLHNPFNSEQS